MQMGLTKQNYATDKNGYFRYLGAAQRSEQWYWRSNGNSYPAIIVEINHTYKELYRSNMWGMRMFLFLKRHEMLIKDSNWIQISIEQQFLVPLFIQVVGFIHLLESVERCPCCVGLSPEGYSYRWTIAVGSYGRACPDGWRGADGPSQKDGLSGGFWGFRGSWDVIRVLGRCSLMSTYVAG